MIERFRLRVPDFLSDACYFRSCRAWLVLSTCLGLQAIIVSMIGFGPLPELPHDPATLTDAGRVFLAVEFDTQAYAAGCFATLLIALLGLWAWNRCLFWVGRDRARWMSRRAPSVMLGAAALDLAVFGIVVVQVAPSLAESRRVPLDVLIALAAPGSVAIAILIIVVWHLLRGAGGDGARGAA